MSTASCQKPNGGSNKYKGEGVWMGGLDMLLCDENLHTDTISTQHPKSSYG